MTEAPSLLNPGDRIAERYQVQRKLGVGGMGEVYAARHDLLGKTVAIKVMLPHIAENPQAVRRFMNEARASVQIESEHVARVLDVARLPSGAPFMVMELLEGQDLADVLDAVGHLPTGEAVDHALQALDALAEAHALGIVHRDIKPANLFLALRRDGSRTLKVLDFGIAKAVAGLHDATLTQSNTIVGSPAYMSPEQIKQSKGVDARADIWSIGVVLYELLTGRLPFEAETVGALFFAISEQTPPLVNTLREGIPEELGRVVARCLARKPEERWQTAGELGVALTPFSGGRAVTSIERLGRAPQPSKVRESQPELVPAVASPEVDATARTMGIEAPTGSPEAVVTAQGQMAHVLPGQEGSIAGSRAEAASGRAKWLLVAGGAVALAGALAFAVRGPAGGPTTPAADVANATGAPSPVPTIIAPSIVASATAPPPPVASVVPEATATVAPAVSALPTRAVAPAKSPVPRRSAASASARPTGTAAPTTPANLLDRN